MSGTLLPIPDDPRFAMLQAGWPEQFRNRSFPRSAWLGIFEAVLGEYYPGSSSRDRSLTARSVAPFPLKDGPNVP